jgi:hypothetical protein
LQEEEEELREKWEENKNKIRSSMFDVGQEFTT